MGMECCKIRTEIDLNAIKIICLKLKTNHCYIHIFNCENETGNEIEINPRLVQIDGMSQISIDNTLYLIGNSKEKENKNFGIYGAKCYNINTTTLPISINFELPSKYHHYYPSLCQKNKESIFVIGGKSTTHCEIFSIEKKNWSELPELPSEKYGCSIIWNDLMKGLMVFGGLNTVTGLLSNEILKWSINNNDWEKIGELKESSICYWSGIVNYKQSIILFGGIGHNNKPTDEIKSIDLTNSDLNLSIIPNLNLMTISKFQFIFSHGVHKGMFYLFDEEDCQIHKILLNPKTCELFSFYRVNNAY